MSSREATARAARASRGWSLVEMLVTVAVVATALGSVVEVTRSSTSFSVAFSRRGDLEERGRCVVDALVRELRWADISTMVLTTQNGSSRISMRTATGTAGGAATWSTTIVYEVDASNVDSNHDGVLNEGCLVRIQDGRRTVLCNNVRAGGFSATLSSRSLQLSVRLQATDADRRILATAVSAAVTPRNKSS